MTIAAVPRPRVYALAVAVLVMPLLASSAGALPEEMDFEALQVEAKKRFKEQAEPFLEAYCAQVPERHWRRAAP
jgi:hypothetical protein